MAKREIPEINAGSMADIAFLLLIFFLVTTTMDKDTAYIRQIPKLIETDVPPPPIEKRNICAIKANAQNQLMFRGIPMEDPSKISEKIVEFYRKNENLNRAETKAALANPAHPGNNFPFYSRVTKAEIESNIAAAEEKAEVAEAAGNDDLVEFHYKEVDEWIAKQSALETYGRNELPEIHHQAHIRVEVQQATEYELFATIQSEIEEAIYELRDDAAKEIFGESYGIIKTRFAMDKSDAKKDGKKLDLLKVLYPDRIIEVKPTR